MIGSARRSEERVLLRKKWRTTRIAESGRQKVLSQPSESTDAVWCIQSLDPRSFSPVSKRSALLQYTLLYASAECWTHGVQVYPITN